MRSISRVSFLLSALLGCSLLCLAQRVEASPPQINQPCGDPSRESMFWVDAAGKVVQVIDGDTVIVLTGKKNRVRVHLAGIAAPPMNQRFGHEAQQFLEITVLGKAVTVLVNPGAWLNKHPQPKEIIGVINLQDGDRRDVNLALIKAGLARHKNSEPYTMSNYTECQYKIAEAEARAAKLGLWQGAA
jgi:endonuclease YncB( thermonuclease family)